MRYIAFFFIVFFCSLSTFAQGEANVWYFGQFAGLDFNSGAPIVLTDGQLYTDEGCASISNASGQLLFYTDGVTIYNRNHMIMPNGSGLMGHLSSTQSATIVPKPGSSTLYYVFTMDAEVGPNGFRYSIVDISLNGGLGDVTTDKNVLIYTPSCEKISIIRHSNNTDFWIITHEINSNGFHANLLTSSGFNFTPVISNSGLNTGPSQFGQCMKIAPDGSKLGFIQENTVQLFDFNTSSGIVSNAQTLANASGFYYGVEFSTNSKVMYVSDLGDRQIKQFDLNAADIAGSITVVGNSYAGSLQLGPDGKVYVARFGSKLDVINNPNLLGNACNYQSGAIDLLTGNCQFGLPAFVQSFLFTPVLFDNSCVNETVQFDINNNLNISSAIWDFGDGSPTQNSLSTTHIYTVPGTYTVTVTANSPSGVINNSREITIYPKPLLNTTVLSLKQCDDDNDGFSSFNLNETISSLVASPIGLTFSFYHTLLEAQNKTNPILSPTTYINQVVSNDVVFARVENANGCFMTAQINLQISTTQIPSSFQKVFTECDDAVLGTNTDGIASFDFSSVTPQIQSIFPVGQQLIITYYRNLADALAENNAITNISNYRNIGSPNTQNIYIRVDSALNNDCLGLGQHITLNVERIPIALPQELNHCDDNQDGLYAFDTSNVEMNLLNGLTNVNVMYFDQNNVPLPSPLPNPFVTASQTITAVVTNATVTACNYQTPIKFVVDDLPEAFAVPVNLTTVCDDELNPVQQDGQFAFDTSTFQSTILNGQTGMIVRYYDANNNLLPSPLPNPFITGTQNVRIEVVNPINTSCTASLVIPLVVKPVPNINLIGNELVCNEQTITKVLDAGIQDGSPTTNYTYVWKLNGTVLNGEVNPTLTINTAGIYTVEVFNSQGCSRIRTITVIASDRAAITNVSVLDLTNNNSIVVNVSGLGNYVYSLDNVTFQQSNTFTNVEAGVYTVYVKDLNGCGIAEKEINVLGIPSFFTPNGDGYNDYWNIKGTNSKLSTTTTIHIFDRFGKLIKQISPSTQGWDGKFNSQPLPATDYWYSIALGDGRIVKGHFALKR